MSPPSRDQSAEKMASSFPLSIATRATTQRNNAGSVGNTIGNPVEIIDCSSDLDNVASYSPYFRPTTDMVTIKQEPGTTTVSAPVDDQGKEPPRMTGQELTEYLEDPVPPLTSVEHANEGESPSLTLEPPTTGGNPLALQCTPLPISYASTTIMNQVPLTTEPPSPTITYAQCVSLGGKAPPHPPPPCAEGPRATPPTPTLRILLRTHPTWR